MCETDACQEETEESDDGDRIGQISLNARMHTHGRRVGKLDEVFRNNEPG